jgi:hypothetical protein
VLKFLDEPVGTAAWSGACTSVLASMTELAIESRAIQTTNELAGIDLQAAKIV